MKIAVVILNWNGKALLEKFLPSVIRHSTEAAIYVADNASTDDSVIFLKNNYPEVKLILNKENGGYAKGYNDALKTLDEDIYVLLNSDVEVTPGWLNPIIEVFKNDSEVAAAQPKILDFNRRDYFEYAGAAGGFIDKYAIPYCRGRIFKTLEKDEGQYDDTAEIFWASGACLFVRAVDFHKIGGFDEDYFAHQEEIDLCWRLKSSGKKILAVGSSKVYHVGGATLDAASAKKTFLNYRNSLFNLYKNYRPNILTTLFIRLSLDGLAGIYLIFQGKSLHTFAIIRAHFSFYGNLSKMKSKRSKYATSFKYFTINNVAYKYFIKNVKRYQRLV